MRVGYARVSTDDQTLDLQLDALRSAGCGLIFDDVVTGASRKRPGLDRLLETLTAGDTVVIWRVDRLGRSFHHLINTAEALRNAGVHLLSLTEGFDTATPIGEAVYRMICIFAELELLSIRERTRAGLRAAEARGQVLGRRRKLSQSDLAKAERFAAEIGVTMAAQRLGVGRSTLYRSLQSKRDEQALRA